jgi:hypothetical protein
MGNDRWSEAAEAPPSGATSTASADDCERDEQPLGPGQEEDEEPSQELPRVSRMTVRL